MQINQDLLGTIPSDISGLKGQILWTNPNLGSAAMAKQDINLKSDNYDVLVIFCCIYGGDGNGTAQRIYSIASIKRKSIFLNVVGNISGRLCGCERELTYVNDKKFTVSDCTIREVSTKSINNAFAIPIYIIGFKTGIFEA